MGCPLGQRLDRNGRSGRPPSGRGKAIEVYGPEQGLANPHVCALFEDSQTNIWAGTAHGLFRLQGRRFVRLAGPASLGDWVKAIFEDREGRFWIGTANGLLSYQEGSFIEHSWPADQLLDLARRLDIRAIAQDRGGDIWVGTIGQGLFRFPQKPWRGCPPDC